MKIYLACIVIISMILLGAFAQGATFNVSTTQELRQALLGAAQNGQSDTIILANGTYATTDDGGGTFIYLDNENYNLTIQGSSAENVILSGVNTHQVLNINVINYNVLISLDSLSIKNGFSTVSGGGFYTNENLIMQNCKIFDNTTTNGDGGGFYAGSLNVGTVTISNSTISYNIATCISSCYNLGGGFFVGGTATISNSTISNNIMNSENGGAGGFYASESVIISNSIVSNNTAGDLGGGFRTPYTSTVSNSIITGNKAGVGGGGFYSGPTNVTSSIISDNNAESNRGGGFYIGNQSSYDSTVLKNCIISGNSSFEEGGGFFSYDDVTLINSIIINNGLNEGIYLYDEINQIFNSAFINNGTYHINGDINSTVTVYNNYIDELKIGIPAFKKDNISSGNLDFVDQPNGDFHIGANSILIDAGTINFEGVTFPDTDLDGYERIWGIVIDIGPYEYIDDDFDGLQNYLEDKICTDPFDADSDNDGIMDGDEDCDNDGFTNAEEVQCASDPGDSRSRCFKGLPWLMLLLE